MLRKLSIALAALSLLAPMAFATGGYAVSVAPDAPSYTTAQVLGGEATVTVTVLDADHEPVENGAVAVSIIRQPWVGNAAREIRVGGTTSSDGTFTFTVPVEAAAPVTYRLIAAYTGAGQTIGEGSLTITAV